MLGRFVGYLIGYLIGRLVVWYGIFGLVADKPGDLPGLAGANPGGMVDGATAGDAPGEAAGHTAGEFNSGATVEGSQVAGAKLSLSMNRLFMSSPEVTSTILITFGFPPSLSPTSRYPEGVVSRNT